MTAYRYVGDDERYYPTLGLTAKPGETYDLTDAPHDGRFEPAAKSRPSKTQE